MKGTHCEEDKRKQNHYIVSLLQKFFYKHLHLPGTT